MVEASRPKLILCHRNYAALLRGVDLHGAKLLHGLPRQVPEMTLPQQIRLSERDFIFFSQSADGHIKSHTQKGTILLDIAHADHLDENDGREHRVLCTTGVSSSAALFDGLLAPLLTGATIIIDDLWTSAERAVMLMERYTPATVLISSPQCRALLQHVEHHRLREALKDTRECLVPGNHVTRALSRQWTEVTGVPLLEALPVDSKFSDASKRTQSSYAIL